MRERLGRFAELWRVRVARRIWMFGEVLQAGMILGAAAFALIVGTSGQAREIFRILLEAPHPDWTHISFALGATVLLSGLLYFTYRSFVPTLEFPPDAGAFTRFIGHAMPYFVASSPWLGAIFALSGMKSELGSAKKTVDALLATSAPEATAQAALLFELIERITINADHAFFLIFSVAAVTLGLLLYVGSFHRCREAICAWSNDVLCGIAILVLMVFGVAAAIGNFLFVDVFRTIGPLGVGALTMISFFALGLLFHFASFFFGMKAWVAAALLVGASYVGLGMNWNKSDIEAAPSSNASRPINSAAMMAQQWIENRNPNSGAMLVISAQGGGMYAAVTSSLMLSRLRDNVPEFNKAVFAISAVSGGAVGSSFYNIFSRDIDCFGAARAAKLESQIPSLVLRDYLGPIVGNLPADLLRKFTALFHPVVDRSDALRASLLAACPAMQMSYDDQWRANGTTPALVLGTTWMSNGHRVAFAPFSLKAAGDGTLWSFGDVYRHGRPTYRGTPFNPSLADAVVTSARFPGALPPLSLRYHGLRHNFGDGGYADASGVTTALELFNVINGFAKTNPQKLKPALLMITFAYKPVDAETQDGTPFSDTWGPVSALLGVRENLADKAITRALKNNISGTDNIIRITVRPDEFGIALGWSLSRTSYEMLSLLVGRAQWCPTSANRDDMKLNSIVRNSCAARDVLKLIRQ